MHQELGDYIALITPSSMFHKRTDGTEERFILRRRLEDEEKRTFALFTSLVKYSQLGAK
jgi:hypothetical protein